jgi:hypothetical protein
MKTASKRFAVVLGICAGFTLGFLALYDRYSPL